MAPSQEITHFTHALITEIRLGLQLATLLIPIDFFLTLLFVKGIHGASTLGSLFFLIDVKNVFTAYIVVQPYG
eukprot:133472-Pelagomonas_calceolata.AAC.3